MSYSSKERKQTIFFLIFLGYLSVLIYLLFTGSTGFNYNQFPLEDKLLHFAAFFCGQFIVMFSGIRKGVFRKTVYLFFTFLPLIAEYVQYHIPTRVTDKWDMIAGYAGIVSCILLFLSIKGIRSRDAKNREDKGIKIKGEL
ncbi:MAG TPA: hypothetical protein PK466_12150 [Thermotogota bacterium]|nr:hypothetical protein [Thermotogota bacterium]HPJ89578.1 hypothetical protein [Thermotogota bacterium]HPR97077.1 hypothetical protein [Thermotogota bacterium]